MSVALDRLKGSIPPLVTPFKDGEVDYDTYARLVAIQIEKGSHGVLVNGTTSEPATLTVEERNRLVDIALSECERFYPAFQFVIWGGKPPNDAVQAALLETVGEA